MNLCDFLLSCKYYVRIICTKGNKKQITKNWYKFSNDIMKMCLEHKTIMKVNDGIKNTKMM